MNVATMKTLACERCGRPIVQNSTGGPRLRFCREAADRPGKSCREVAAEEAGAFARAGLGEVVAAFRADRDAVLEALRPVLGPVAALDARLQEIENTAIAHAQSADENRRQAEAAQTAAEAQARTADERAEQATQARDAAVAEREQAVEDAQRYQRETAAAVTRAVAAEHARGQAEGAAAEQRRALEHAHAQAAEQSRALEHAHAQAAEQSERARAQAAEVAAEQRQALQAESERRAAAESEAARLQKLLEAAQQDVTTLRDDLLAAERRTSEVEKRAQADLRAASDQAQQKNDQAASDLAAAQAAAKAAETAAKAAETAAQAAEQRFRTLLESLATGGFIQRQVQQESAVGDAGDLGVERDEQRA